MCRDDGKGEIFLDVLPGYLQIDYNVATCFDDIGGCSYTRQSLIDLIYTSRESFTVSSISNSV